MSKGNSGTRRVGSGSASSSRRVSAMLSPTNSGSTYAERADNVARIRDYIKQGNLRQTASGEDYLPLDSRAGIFIYKDAATKSINARLQVDGQFVDRASEGRFYGTSPFGGTTTEAQAFNALSQKLGSSNAEVYEKYLHPEGRRFVEGASGSQSALMALLNRRK